MPININIETMNVEIKMSQGFTGSFAIPLVVANGGTGKATNTAYAVQCGGTTTTDPAQSIASVGTAAQVLTSNGAGALPTFQAAATIATPVSVANGGTGSAVGSLVDCDDVAWTDWSGSIGFTGFSVDPIVTAVTYKKVGRTCFIDLNLSTGTSNLTSFSVTGLPFTSGATGQLVPIAVGYDAGSPVHCWGTISGSGTTLSLSAPGGGTSWTNTGTKYAQGVFCYQTA